MKRIIMLIVLATAMLSCQRGNINRHTVGSASYTIRNNDMTYRVYLRRSGGIHVVNETLDSLKLLEYKNKFSK